MAAEIYRRPQESQVSHRLTLALLVLSLVPSYAAAAGEPKAPKPSFTVVLTQAFLQELVTAAAPFDTTQEYEVGALGITRTLSYTLHLRDPTVKVAGGKIIVPMKFDASGGGGLVNASGEVSPELTIVRNQKTGELEARLSKADISIGGIGLAVPVEDVVEPMVIPGVLPSGDIELPHKTLTADVRLAGVQIGDGVVKIHGSVTFTPKAKVAPKPKK